MQESPLSYLAMERGLNTNALRYRLPNVPYVSSRGTRMGDNAAMTILISLEDENQWVNNIFYNSRYMIFILFSDGGLEMSGKSLDIKGNLMRKTRVVSVEEAITKIENYIKRVLGND